MTTKEYIENGEKYLMHTYNRYQVVLEKGDGVYLYDTDGKKYLDFNAGIAVYALGYNNKEYNDALKNQIDNLLHTSNYYYSAPTAEAARKVCEASGMEKVFFTNSGAEAIEGALKIAKKYAKNKNHEIIAMKHSFHGRTIGALSATGNEHYREAFNPLVPNIKFAEFNNLDSVKELVNSNTCAIILETVQGEGGIYPASAEFIKGVRKICDDNDLIMIADEVQCGMGRTGKMYAYQHFDVLPDVVCTAKALGCGVPVGAFLARGKAKDVLVPGDHGSTYGGNPFVTCAVSTVFDLFEKYNVLDNVNKVSKYLEEKLDGLVSEFDIVDSRRGLGFMQGLVLKEDLAGKVVSEALDKGLIIITAGANVVRFVPPLVIKEENVDEMIGILRGILKEI